MGLPKSFTRSRSLNAKYDRMLGSTQSVRSGKGSTNILAEVGTQFRLSGEEKQEKVQRDNAEIYRKLGIKMPAKGSRDMNGDVGVMEKLERYRLGNVPPPRGITPPVELDEKLRKILYPTPPPPAPLTPTPPPHHLYNEHYYPTGSRVGHTMQGVHPQPTPRVDYRQYQTQGPPPSYPPPPPQAMGGQVNGWVFTQANGWIFIPPPQAFPSAYQGYPPMPPPPPFAQGYPTQSAYPSSYSDVPSSSERGESPLKYYTPNHDSHQMRPQQHHSHIASHQEDFDPRTHHSHYPTTQHMEIPQSAQREHFDTQVSPYADQPDHSVAAYHTPAQTQSFPRGILRDSSSSEVSGHGRSVKFRDTPDYAFPELFAQEIAEGPRSDVCSPPEWKLRKIKPASRAVEPDPRSVSPQEVHYQDEEDMYKGDGPRPVDPTKGRFQEGSHGDGIPALLATAHQQLVSSHGGQSSVSGKRSGRDLVRNLESLVEVENESDEGKGQPREEPPLMTNHQQTTTPRRQHEHHGAGLRQAPSLHFVSTTPRRQIPAVVVPTPRYQDRIEPRTSVPNKMPTLQSPSSPKEDGEQGGLNQSRSSHHQNAAGSRRPHSSYHQVRHQQDRDETARQDEKKDGSRQGRTPGPAEPVEQVQNRYKTQTPQAPPQPRKIANKNRLPPPSQNWRESQRPQMAFSQDDSIASQDMGSQMSVQGQSQDQGPKPSGKKRGRQGWRDDEDEYEGGDQTQKVHPDSYSPDQYSHSDRNYSQAPSTDHPDSRADHEHHQSQERRSRSTSAAPTAPMSSSTPHRRHRLNNLDIPPDDDPSDHSYHPNIIAEEEDELEFDDSQNRSPTASPEYEPEGKRIKLTEGAWAKYDIPQDKLPAPPPIRAHVPFLQSYNKSRFSHHHHNQKQKKSRNEVNDENIKSSQTQSQSQISQIENPDDEDEMENWLNEDIDESWSQCLSDPPVRDMKGGKTLSTIAEEEEDEGMGQMADVAGRGNSKGWVEEGFFGECGDAGFRVWRDRY